jgi:hypothetical protein
MESKTKSVDLTVRASFALVQGAIIAMALPMFYFLVPAYVQASPAMFLFGIIPLLSFVTSLIINWFLQFLYCSKIDLSKITIASTISPVFTVVVSGLVYLLPFLRTPVTQLFTSPSTDNPVETELTREIWGYSFYLLWAGIYSQTLGLGMASACS